MKTRSIFPGLLLATLLGLTPLHTYQYWWHLSIGRLIDRFSSIPAANHFVYTAPADAPSLIQPWMSQWLLFFLHDVGSIELVLIARNLLAAITLIAVTFTAAAIARKHATRPFIPLLAAAIATLPLAATIDATPILFALPLFALLLAVASAVFIHKKHPALLLLFPATASLWANLAPHYLAPALLAAACTAAIVATTKNRTHLIAGTLATTLSFAAIFATPHQFHILQDISNNLIPAPRDVIPLLTLALIPLSALLPFKTTVPAPEQPETTPLTHKIILASALILLTALAVLAQPFTEPQADFAARTGIYNARERWPHKGHLHAEHPLDCIEALRQTGKEFRVLHPREFAGIIIFRLQSVDPRPAVFLDPRSEFVPPEILQLNDLLNTPGVGRGLAQQYKLNAAILNNQRQANLIADLERDPTWYLLNQDAHTTCFYKL